MAYVADRTLRIHDLRHGTAVKGGPQPGTVADSRTAGSGAARRTFFAAVAEPQQGWLQPGALLGVRYDPMRPRSTALRHAVDPSGRPVPFGGPPIISGYYRFAGVCAWVSALASLVVFALSFST